MRITPESTNAQIVLIGQFNPVQFVPTWMAEQGLIGFRDADAAEVRVADEAIADYSTDWCRVFVTPERFVIASQQAPWVRLSDLSVKLFAEVLPETKMSFMGINRSVQFETGSLGARDKLGRDLAPRNIWGDWGEALEKDEGKGESGLVTMTMRQGHGLNDRTGGHIDARIGPGPGSSVVVTVNDHYESTEKDAMAASHEFMKILGSRFEESLKRSEWIVDQIMRRIKP